MSSDQNEGLPKREPPTSGLRGSSEESRLTELAERAWERLQILHYPFRATETEEFQKLTSSLRDLESVILRDPYLADYYQECNAPESERQSEDATAVAATRAYEPPVQRKISHISVMQLQLMEDAYFALRLDRYANSPDNRGWMNLFRRWGRSRIFNAQYERLHATFTKEFTAFYETYVRCYEKTVDERSIPHPWDPKALRTVPPFRGQPERVVLGVYLDSGFIEATPEGNLEIPLARPEPGAHGIADQKGIQYDYATPPSADGSTAPPSGGSTPGAGSSSEGE